MSGKTIGVIQRQLDQERIESLSTAIIYHLDQYHSVPIEWVQEYNDLTKEESE